MEAIIICPLILGYKIRAFQSIYIITYNSVYLSKSVILLSLFNLRKIHGFSNTENES